MAVYECKFAVEYSRVQDENTMLATAFSQMRWYIGVQRAEPVPAARTNQTEIQHILMIAIQ